MFYFICNACLKVMLGKGKNISSTGDDGGFSSVVVAGGICVSSATAIPKLKNESICFSFSVFHSTASFIIFLSTISQLPLTTIKSLIKTMFLESIILRKSHVHGTVLYYS